VQATLSVNIEVANLMLQYDHLGITKILFCPSSATDTDFLHQFVLHTFGLLAALKKPTAYGSYSFSLVLLQLFTK
jgi:hypothetical protein